MSESGMVRRDGYILGGLTCRHMTAELLGDLCPHGRCDAAAHVQLVVGVPDLRIFLDRLQELGSIYERILLGHGHSETGHTGTE